MLRWNIYIFGQEMFGLAPDYDVELKTFGRKWHKKTDIMTSKRHPDIMHESHLTQHNPVSHTAIPVRYARNYY